jgi:hypothetical protein
LKELTLWMFALAALQGSGLQAQNITGNWQGTLEVGQRKVRLVFKIALEDDKLKATLYTADQPSPPIATTITQAGSTVKMTIPSIAGSYEGKLNADGNSIAGTFSQGAQLPLNLARTTPESAWAIPEPPPPPKRMAPDANPAFEVATIKPSDPAHPEQIITLRGAEVITTNVTVHALINLAYWLHPKQLTGGPAWTESDKFDMAGKPDAPGQPNVDQMKVMIQKLLADRFQLKFHFQKREVQVYAVRLAKTGAKITKSQDDPKGIPGWNFGRNPSGTIMAFRNSLAGRLWPLSGRPHRPSIAIPTLVRQWNSGEIPVHSRLNVCEDAAPRPISLLWRFLCLPATCRPGVERPFRSRRYFQSAPRRRDS